MDKPKDTSTAYFGLLFVCLFVCLLVYLFVSFLFLLFCFKVNKTYRYFVVNKSIIPLALSGHELL